jgi:hypothetical protein
LAAFAIATGADADYFHLVQELVASITEAAPAPVPIAVIDAGLRTDQLAWLSANGIAVLPPSTFDQVARAVRKRPALAVNLGKLWLDTYLPDYQTIVWLDADTWVQDWSAVQLLLDAAQTGAMAVVPGSGRFHERVITIRWFLAGIGQVRSFNYKNARNARLPLSICRDLGTRAQLNAGAFALRTDAPHWQAMRRWQQTILRHGKPFTSDQLAMALATYRDGLPLELMPTRCNTIVPRRVDTTRLQLLELYYPYRPVGIVHLAAQAMRKDARATVPLLGNDGRTYHVNLRHGIFQRMMREATAAKAAPADCAAE